MNQQIAAIQKNALRDLYERIKQIVKSMNGTSNEMEARSSLPNQMSDGPTNLNTPALHIDMQNGYVVDFKPSLPLGFGNAVSVIARRTLPSGVLSDIGFSFINGEWQSGGNTLSDEVIRACLIPKGPVPVQ